jgi:hypothetical protein
MSLNGGVDLAMFAIFVLAVGLSIVQATYTDLTTNSTGGTTGAELGGVSAAVLGYAPLIVVAVFIYGVARIGGVL